MLISNVICETTSFLRILLFLNIARRLLFIVMPIVLILVLTIRTFKNIVKAEENYREYINDSLKKIGAVVIIFFIPTVVNIVMSLIGNEINYNYKTCLSNANLSKIEYYKGVEEKVLDVKDLIDKVKRMPTTENLTKAENAVSSLYGVANGMIIEDLEYSLASIRSKVVMSDDEFVCMSKGGIYENNECIFKKPSIQEKTTSNGMLYYTFESLNDYLVVNTPLDVANYINFLKENRICQDQENGTVYYDQCLCFAEEQIHSLTTGDISRKSFEVPGKYYNNYVIYSDDDKDKVLNVVYSELINNKPVILHVNGDRNGTSRHYVTVIGFKSTVTSAADFKETDILLIDSFDCKVEQLHEWGTSRFMTTGKKCNKPDYTGYQVYMYV
ncbi:MAG: hypothetical protein IKN63_00170 [Bacilli bacterium]|nr:hypothetical protein [Bacilli bacterium]